MKRNLKRFRNSNAYILFVVFLIAAWSIGITYNMFYSKNKKKLTPEEAKIKYEKKVRKLGLVDIQEIDNTIIVDISHHPTRNFIESEMYMTKCFLQKEVAYKLVKANKILKLVNPNYTLFVADCFRPRSLQILMWFRANKHRRKYIANPRRGSMHNYAAAVDVTIMDKKTDKCLDMGTGIGRASTLSQPRKEKYFLKRKRLLWSQYKNRRILRYVMVLAGFHILNIEWWHYNGFDRKTIRKKYKMID